MKSKILFGLMTFLAIGIAAYAALAYSLLPLGAAVLPEMRDAYQQHAAWVYLHIFGASLVLLLGPLQFSAKLRASRPVVHRWIGRLYLSVGYVAVGVAGLYVSQFAYGGTVARLGFASLAVVWMLSAAAALVSILKGNVAQHRRWMVRNFALTLAGVTLRLYMPLSMVAGIPFAQAYPVIAWLCWVPNLIVAQWLVRRTTA